MNDSWKYLKPYIFIYFLTELLLRITLLGRALVDIELSLTEIISILVRGLWFDIVTACFVLIPVVLIHTFVRPAFWEKRAGIITRATMLFIFTFLIFFGFISEHIFWTEFATRFNFIAVDYLIYTQEVIGNIRESYSVEFIIPVIALAAALITKRCHNPKPPSLSSFSQRLKMLAYYLGICLVGYTMADMRQSQVQDNAEASEIAANGIYNLFYAFWNNEISYEKFYAIQPETSAAKNARNLLWEKDSDVKFIHDDGKDLTRIVRSGKKEQHKNIMLVVMESMSANYMGYFGNTQGLTPNLDKLAKESLIFTNTYATGTRTVRGLEAVTLSIPPTPGQSIIRRPNNDNLFSLGFILKDRGYDTKFIYGGYGYFDNMNTFFAGNGFDILDRTKMDKSEINFANVWGICDEDMFTRAIKEADISYAANKPFMHLVMTTSNHRPYTYPDGKIDIPSHSNRLGGVKYADYSIGALIDAARKKPWFKDTVFIFVADHTAGAGGKAELDPKKYHIPMIFYAPQFIKPRTFTNISSQIDLPPILLGLLDFTYYTKFYGEDLLHDDDEIPHAFISNYQKVALVKKDGLTVLAPKRKVDQFSWPTIEQKTHKDETTVSDAVAYYQSASWWKEQYKRIPTVISK